MNEIEYAQANVRAGQALMRRRWDDALRQNQLLYQEVFRRYLGGEGDYYRQFLIRLNAQSERIINFRNNNPDGDWEEGLAEFEREVDASI